MLAFVIHTLAFTLGQTVEVRLAPDQPAPLFFSDEPLVVQVHADGEATVALNIDVDLPDGRRASWKPAALVLGADRTKWLTMDGLPVLRGPHVFHIHTSPDAPPVERRLARIDRPAIKGPASVVLAIAVPSVSSRYAAQCIGAGIQLPAQMPGLESEVAAFAHPNRGPIYVLITASNGRHTRSVESVVSGLRDRVELWTVNGAISFRESVREGVAVRSIDPAAVWAPRIEDAREVGGLLRGVAAPWPGALVGAPASAQAISEAAARAGAERMPLLVDFSDDPAVDSPQGMLRRLWAEGLGRDRIALIPQGLVETSIGFTGALAALAAAREELGDAQDLGLLAQAGNNTLRVVQLGPSAAPETWALTVAVADTASPMSTVLPGEGATWEVLDAYGNSLGDFGRPGGSVAFPAGQGAWYVRGHGGTLLRDALAARIRALAQASLADSSELAAAAPEAATALEALATYELPAAARLQFFALLRALPAIEEDWRRGLVETRDAIPMVRDLSAIAELVAALEQELAEPLLEPLDKTLDTCSEWLARYPIAAAGDPRDVHRLAFVRGEVFRLTERARAWDAAGRKTEAKGVAAIAEWRARSLEAAATLPWPQVSEDAATDEPVSETPVAETEDAMETDLEVDE